MRVAQAEYVIGKNPDGGRESYTIVEKINGKNLYDLEWVDAAAKEEIDQSFSGYLGYVQGILKQGGEFWYDLNLRQMVYGTRNDETQPHLYVVDLDPISHSWMTDEERSKNHSAAFNDTFSVITELLSQVSYIKEIEHKLIQSGKLGKTRTALNNIINALRPIILDFNDRDLNRLTQELDAEVAQ